MQVQMAIKNGSNFHLNLEQKQQKGTNSVCELYEWNQSASHKTLPKQGPKSVEIKSIKIKRFVVECLPVDF